MKNLRHCFVLILTLVAGAALGQDWPQFRGPGGMGISDARGLPVQWSGTQNVVWKTELPGPGASSPVVSGNRVFVSCYSGYGVEATDPGDPKQLRRHLLCVNLADGSIIWDRQMPAEAKVPYRSFQARHGYASSTPVTDGERVFVFYGKDGVLAYSMNGRPLWRTSVGTRTHSWGSGASPILYRNLVIVNASVESGSLVALDSRSGRVAWRAAGIRQSWATPMVIQVPRRGAELVLSIQGSILGLDPSTGRRLWFCEGIDQYVCPSVVAEGDVVFAIGGRRGTAVAVKAGGQGEVEPLWTQRAGSNVSSPVVHDGHLYWVSDRGIAYCLNTRDGQVVYQERLEGRRVEAYASAVLAEGRIYCVTRNSGTYVLAARPRFQQLAHNELEPDTSVFNASPAVADGQLLLRSDRYLYCIGQK